MPDPTAPDSQDTLHWAIDDLGNAFVGEDGVIAVPVTLDGQLETWAIATEAPVEEGLYIHALVMNEELLGRIAARAGQQAFRFRGEPVRGAR